MSRPDHAVMRAMLLTTGAASLAFLRVTNSYSAYDPPIRINATSATVGQRLAATIELNAGLLIKVGVASAT